MQTVFRLTAATCVLFGSCVQAADNVFDIPSQSLSQALVKFSEQADTVVMAPQKLLEGKKASQVQGKMSVQEALNKLLEGTGLEASESDRGSVAIHEAQTSGDARQSSLMIQLAQSEAVSTAVIGHDDEKGEKGRGISDGGGGALEEIIVTAQKREERLQDVPISISVLSGRELDSSTYSGVTDALEAVPGFVALPQLTSGSTIFSLRGVSSGGSGLANGAGPVAYYVDGVPFGFVRNGFYPTDPSIYDLERIEVLNGPQGTLYGANSLSGVIRILTHDADPNAFDFKARTSISGTDGGGENYSGDVAVNVPLIDGRLAARAVVGFREDSGWIDATGSVGVNALGAAVYCPSATCVSTPTPDGYGRDVNSSEARNYRLQVRALPTDTLTVDLSAWRSEREADDVPLSDDDRRIPTPIPQPSDERFTAYGLSIIQKFSAFSLSSMTSYIDYHSQMFPHSHPGGELQLNTNFYSEVFSQEFNLTSDSEGPWRWSAGAFYRHAKDLKFQILNDGLTLVPRSNPFDDFTDRSESYAVYGEVGRSIFENVDLAVGLRYFHDDQAMRLNQTYSTAASVPVGVDQKATSEAVTPRVVLTWQPADQYTLYTSYSQGFRSGFEQTPRTLHLIPQIATVEPDKLTNYEIGAKGSLFSGRLTYEVAAFYQDWQDIQRSASVTIPPANSTSTTAVFNGSGASGPGASLSLTTSPIDGLELGANVSWNGLEMDGDVQTMISVGSPGVLTPITLFRSGDQLAISPEYTAAVSAAYAWNLGGGYSARISGSANYIPPMPTDPAVVQATGAVVLLESDEYLMANARFSIEAPRNWIGTLFVDNLTDEYATLNPSFPNAFSSARPRPRTYGVQVEYRYGK